MRKNLMNIMAAFVFCSGQASAQQDSAGIQEWSNGATIGELADTAVTISDPDELELGLQQVAVLLKRGQLQEAITQLTRLIKLHPRNMSLLAQRAETYRAASDDEHALQDSAAVLKRRPQWADMRLMRANIFNSQGREAEALAEGAAIEADARSDVYAQLVAGSIYRTFDETEKAFRAYDRALSIKPDGATYVNRAVSRPKDDFAGRLADLDMALSMRPNLLAAMSEKGAVLRTSGDYAGSIAYYTEALTRYPGSAELLVGRGLAHTMAGSDREAEKDFGMARANAIDSETFTAMCQAKSIANLALESALADCNSAVATSIIPDRGLSMRGTVLLQLGRYDEAIRDYDEALAKRPQSPWSRFGRAVAWSRKGETARAAEELAAAEALNPNIRKRVAEYGITYP